MREYTAQAIQRQLSEEPSECLTAREAQVLAELWDNPDNAVYDDRP